MIPNQKYLMNKYKCLYFQAIFRFHFKIGAFYVWFSQPIRPSSWHFKRQNVKLSEVWFADHRMKVFFNFPKVKYLENVKTYSRVQALHHLSVSQNWFLNGITESTWLSENVNYYFTSASTAPFDFIKIIFLMA